MILYKICPKCSLDFGCSNSKLHLLYTIGFRIAVRYFDNISLKYSYRTMCILNSLATKKVNNILGNKLF